MGKRGVIGWGAFIVLGIATVGVASCSDRSDRSSSGRAAEEAANANAAAIAGHMPEPSFFAGPVDTSHVVVQRNPHVDLALPGSSRALRDLPSWWPEREEDEEERVPEPGKSPFQFEAPKGPDAVLQSTLPKLSMPVTLQNFLGQGTTRGGCIFPKPDGGEPPGCTTKGDPPDTVGAVGPNHYVQTVNSGVAVWDKSGNLVAGPKFTSLLFQGINTADGNRCGADANDPNGGDWGDAVVLYDQLADRWVITQFDITNGVKNSQPPSYQCVAVSKTGDPTGAYWLYSFKYNVQVNDYGKFSVWPDAYYATFNNFNTTFVGANNCAYDRASMLQGKPATQQCFGNGGFGFLSSNVDGQIKPPNGEPAFFVTLTDNTTLGLYTFHVDWTTPANSAFTGPTNIPVSGYTKLCNGGSCVKQPSPGNALASLGDRPMFHLSYRNFGDHESLVFNHSVAGGGGGGIRWYEIWSPNGSPTVHQQNTYAPADGNYRWMGSIAQDQAMGIALGFAISGSSTKPSIGWTGRIASDAVNTMGQGEAIINPGGGVETGTFSNGQAANRFGDYSNMTVDPTDDCTFWYTQEAYPSNGIFNWDTHVSSTKFSNCAANDFKITITPAAQNVAQGSTTTFTVKTTSALGSAEAIQLFLQDLPSGVTGAFAPTSVSTGASSTLTLTAAANAPATPAPVTFTVIGHAPSAVHAATAQVSVVLPGQTCGNGVLDNGEQCDDGPNNGAAGDCCTSTCQFRPSSYVCGAAAGACDIAATCTGSTGGACPPNGKKANGTPCPDGNVCNGDETCQNGACAAGTPLNCDDKKSCTTDSCDPTAGCKHANVTDNTACTDSPACTTSGKCMSGACVGSPVTCTAQDECHTAGTCDTASNTCSSPRLPGRR